MGQLILTLSMLASLSLGSLGAVALAGACGALVRALVPPTMGGRAFLAEGLLMLAEGILLYQGSVSLSLLGWVYRSAMVLCVTLWYNGLWTRLSKQLR